MNATMSRHPVLSVKAAERRNRVEQLQRIEIEFIGNSEFANERLSQSRRSVIETTAQITPPANGAAHLRNMCDVPVLDQHLETTLFREMNLLKYQAHTLRSRLDSANATEGAISAVESRLAHAQAIRDHIIRANIRLVVSVVKKFATPQQPFDELLSEGIVALMRAVEKFDYDRGFRFSTYAYRSIARHVYQSVSAACRAESRLTRDAEEWAFEQESGLRASAIADQMWSKLRARMTAMLTQLDRREQFIIRSRYALGAHRAVRPLQYLAEKLGLSKERVRQIEKQAVAKMRAMADDLEHDDLFSAAMA